MSANLWYTAKVQTPFFVSGFLYSLKTHQILLLKTQKKDSSDFLWSTIKGENHKNENAPAAFQRIISQSLGLNIKIKDIYPIYDYFHDKWNKDNFVFYAEVKHSKQFDRLKKDNFSWVSFDEISKLLFTTNCKQDVIVGQRVINAKFRDDEESKSKAISDNLAEEVSFGMAK